MIRILQGIDLVPVARFRKVLLDRPGLASELFTVREREYCLSRPDPAVHFAGRFAAKEACLKALGTGLSGTGIDAALLEIEILPARSGAPVLSITGWTAKVAARKHVLQHTVSISHSGDFAVASVIMTARTPKETPAKATAT